MHFGFSRVRRSGRRKAPGENGWGMMMFLLHCVLKPRALLVSFWSLLSLAVRAHSTGAYGRGEGNVSVTKSRSLTKTPGRSLFALLESPKDRMELRTPLITNPSTKHY